MQVSWLHHGVNLRPTGRVNGRKSCRSTGTGAPIQLLSTIARQPPTRQGRQLVTETMRNMQPSPTSRNNQNLGRRCHRTVTLARWPGRMALSDWYHMKVCAVFRHRARTDSASLHTWLRFISCSYLWPLSAAPSSGNWLASSPSLS